MKAVPLARERGFSLGELLIVIGIIAILAALLTPVFVRAREAAHKASAMSNLHQVVVAQILYASDSDDVSVPYFSGYEDRNGLYGSPDAYWPQLIAIYLKSPDTTHGYHGQAIDIDLPSVFFDPAVPFRAQAAGDFGFISSWGISDAIVDWIGPKNWKPTHRPARLSEISEPANTYMDVGTRDYFRKGLFPGDALALAPNSSYGGLNAAYSTAGHYAGSDDFANLPATGRALVAFCDCHIKSPQASKVATEQYGWCRLNPNVWP